MTTKKVEWESKGYRRASEMLSEWAQLASGEERTDQSHIRGDTIGYNALHGHFTVHEERDPEREIDWIYINRGHCPKRN